MRKWLKDLREANKLTMKEMVVKLSILESYYCAIENGTRQKKMDIALVAALSIAFAIPMETIVQLESEWTSLSVS